MKKNYAILAITVAAALLVGCSSSKNLGAKDLGAIEITTAHQPLFLAKPSIGKIMVLDSDAGDKSDPISVITSPEQAYYVKIDGKVYSTSHQADASQPYLIKGQKIAYVHGVAVDDISNPKRGHAIWQGIVTNPAQIPTTGTATYKGQAVGMEIADGVIAKSEFNAVANFKEKNFTATVDTGADAKSFVSTIKGNKIEGDELSGVFLDKDAAAVMGDFGGQGIAGTFGADKVD